MRFARVIKGGRATFFPICDCDGVPGRGIRLSRAKARRPHIGIMLKRDGGIGWGQSAMGHTPRGQNTMMNLYGFFIYSLTMHTRIWRGLSN